MDANPGTPAKTANRPLMDPVQNSLPAGSRNKTPSPFFASRQSPVTPLAPLEYLQNQRRGSITDPSLHASGSGSHSSKHSFRHSDPLAPASHSRPHSSYRFGEASSGTPDNSLPNIRQLLRSPTPEEGSSDTSKEQSGSDRSPKSGGVSRAGVPREHNGSRGAERMDIDTQPGQYAQHNPSPQDRPNFDSFDFNARRPSIAGTKRKMSSDRMPGDIDPQLVGPGVPSSSAETEGPAPKRRGSAIDTSRIAQLSLQDRRSSVDSRASGTGSQWWGNDRRDSASSVFSATPLTGYSTPSSGFPGDSPHGRPPSGIATFAWPASSHQEQSSAQAQIPPPSEGGMSAPPYDPAAMMPPVSFTPDRRMSAPVISADNLPPPPSSGPTRTHRSRSRPPSRVRTRDQVASSSTGQPQSGPIPEDVTSSPAQSNSSAALAKESGSTPYSRSPELRISHKLAERKRRKEMKDLFDELRDQLPADRGMKASKWEILSKAIDFIMTLKQSHQDMSREVDMLRHELEGFRQGMPPPFGPGGPPPMYTHGPPVGVPYPPPHGGPPGPPPQQQSQPPQVGSRPGSSQNMYPPPAPGHSPTQNGSANAGNGTIRTDTPT